MKKHFYGSFLQDGGQMDPQSMPIDSMMAQDPAAAQAMAPDPQAIAQEFLAAFQQLPPEAQQIVAQTIMQMAQG